MAENKLNREVENENKFLAFFKGLWSKMLPVIKGIGSEIKENILTKWIGCFVGLAALLLTVVNAIVYSNMLETLFNPAVIAYCVVGIVFFAALSLFKQTSWLAPITLMLTNILSIGGFASADGMIDYVTSTFFGGFSVEAWNSLPIEFRFCLVSFVITFIISSVAIYLPQNRKPKARAEDVKENTDGNATVAEGEAQ